MKKTILTTFILTTFLLIVLVSYDPVRAENNVVIDFEGLEAGAFVQSVYYGQGIHGMQVDGSVTIFGYNKFFPGENAAMIFDAGCPGGCTGFDFDLEDPDQGMVMIVSQDMDASDPNDARFAASLEFYFQDLGAGKVTVDSLTIGDVDSYEEGGMLEFYSGGRDGTLLATLPIPITQNGIYKHLPVDVSGVDYMRVFSKGSAAIDDIILFPEPEEVLYLSDTVVKYDGISKLHRVEIDEVNNKANLILLPNGLVDYDHVDTLASTPNGSRLYFVDEDTLNDDDSLPILAYYDHETATVHEIGVIEVDGVDGETVEVIDQAAFSPDGTLYLTGSILNKLYTVNPENAEAVELGTVVTEKESEKVVLNIAGADIAFTENGTLYLWINRGKEDAPAGLYILTLPGQDGQVMAEHLGLGASDHVFLGLALRANGIGDLVGMTRDDELHIMERADATDVVPPLPLYLDGEPFDATSGDMSIGPFAEESVSSR